MTYDKVLLGDMRLEKARAKTPGKLERYIRGCKKQIKYI